MNRLKVDFMIFIFNRFILAYMHPPRQMEHHNRKYLLEEPEAGYFVGTGFRNEMYPNQNNRFPLRRPSK